MILNLPKWGILYSVDWLSFCIFCHRTEGYQIHFLFLSRRKHCPKVLEFLAWPANPRWLIFFLGGQECIMGYHLFEFELNLRSSQNFTAKKIQVKWPCFEIKYKLELQNEYKQIPNNIFSKPKISQLIRPISIANWSSKSNSECLDTLHNVHLFSIWACVCKIAIAWSN